MRRASNTFMGITLSRRRYKGTDLKQFQTSTHKCLRVSICLRCNAYEPVSYLLDLSGTTDKCRDHFVGGLRNRYDAASDHSQGYGTECEMCECPLSTLGSWTWKRFPHTAKNHIQHLKLMLDKHNLFLCSCTKRE